MEQTTEYQEVKGNRNIKSTLFHNGTQDEPDEKILLLSDAFQKESEQKFLDKT